MLECVATFETNEIDGICHEVTATVRLYEGRPAKTYGPPEDCYPEEPAEVEIFDVNIAGLPYLASDGELERWSNLIYENPENYFLLD